MKFFIDNWVLFLAAVTSGGLLLWPMITQGSGGWHQGQRRRGGCALINREEGGSLIDVSEASEFASGHAAGSKSIPLGGLETAADLPKNKTLPVVVLCATGARSTRAVATLKKLGFDNPRALAGGLAAWREANLPVEKTA